MWCGVFMAPCRFTAKNDVVPTLMPCPLAQCPFHTIACKNTCPHTDFHTRTDFHQQKTKLISTSSCNCVQRYAHTGTRAHTYWFALPLHDGSSARTRKLRYAHALAHTHTRIYTYAHIHTDLLSPCMMVPLHAHTITHTHTHTHIHTRIHTHTYIHTHIHTHIHTYTHIKTHTQGTGAAHFLHPPIKAHFFVCSSYTGRLLICLCSGSYILKPKHRDAQQQLAC